MFDMTFDQTERYSLASHHEPVWQEIFKIYEQGVVTLEKPK